MRIAFAGRGEAKLSGGMIMAVLIGNEMQRQGHEPVYLTERPAADWTGVEFPHRPGSVDRAEDLAGLDAVITGWDCVGPALEAGVPVVAHLCAGYEPDLWPARRAELEAAYRLPTLKLVIAPHLRDRLREDLGLDSVVVGAPVNLEAFHPRSVPPRGEGAPLRVLTVGPEPDGPFAPVPFKGIAQVLEIVERARDAGADLELVRLTPKEDRFVGSEVVDELHVGVPPASVPEIYRSCDVYLGASTRAEGLGMPALEAACSGLALILPEIPSFAEIDELRRGARLYPAGATDAAADRLVRLAGEQRRAAGAATPFDREQLIARFAPAAVAKRTLAAIQSALPTG